ncbi:MAG: potassium-transporting ATPase subunit KdpC [Candidatus Omnitrophica bacterium]|nr:potassium-transporting ATPase subunit KdpC [Candidatus Omnitrophota bacterium]
MIFTVLTGFLYPLFVTAIAQTAFSHQANGSLVVVQDGKVLGSSLIGQNFDDPKYFWGRISASTPAYNAASSSGSNLGPLNQALLQQVKGRIAALKAVDPGNKAPIPVDLVTSSASGLDPHISMAAAYYQLSRVAKARGMRVDDVRRIVEKNTQDRLGGLLGEPVVNVLGVNLALDEYKK